MTSPLRTLMTSFAVLFSVLASPLSVPTATFSASDLAAPEVVEFDVAPRNVDVSRNEQVVTVRARVTDDSDVQPSLADLISKTTSQTVTGERMQLVSGTNRDGWWETRLTVPRGAAPGAWYVLLYPPSDSHGNRGSSADYPQFDRSLTVTNTTMPDLAAPEVVEFDVAPRNVDVSRNEQVVTVRARVTDDSDVQPSLADLISKTTSQTVTGERMQLVSGTNRDGWWETRLTVPRGAAPGAWYVLLYPPSDSHGNVGSSADYPQFDRSLTVTNTGDDRVPPNAPTNVRATAGNSSASVSWNPPTIDGDAAVTSYIVTASPGGSTATVPAPATSATVAGLTNGSSYTFTVAAVNSAGNSRASAPTAAVTPRTVADAPTTVSGTPGNGSTAVSWAAPRSDGGAAIGSYIVTAAPGGRTETVPGSSTVATVTGLTNGVTYTFTVVAVNAAGNSVASAPSSAVTPRTVATAPFGASATAGVASAVVSWSAPSSTGGAAILSYSVTASPGGRTATATGSATTATVTGLTSGVAYTFTIVAVNPAGSSAASTASAPVTPFDSLERISGVDRFATAAAISDRFPVGVNTVYIASGVGFPDALAGAALASLNDAPILLARPTGVPQPTIEALQRLQPTNIVILGGTPTLSDAVRQQLLPFGNVSRIAGADRFATAAMISKGFDPGIDTVYVASGMTFPDALAGAALAGATGSPVLLTAPGDLRPSVADALQRLDPQRIVVLGSTPSVSRNVEVALREFGTVSRIAGADRFETASLIAAQFPASDRVFVANGANFPDALAGAAFAGGEAAPVILVLRDYLPPTSVTQIERLGAEQVFILGDEHAIGSQVAAQLRVIVQ